MRIYDNRRFCSPTSGENGGGPAIGRITVSIHVATGDSTGLADSLLRRQLGLFRPRALRACLALGRLPFLADQSPHRYNEAVPPERISTSEEQNQRLLAQYNELAELAGSLAHEIKNPLSVIRMNMDLLAEDLADAQTQRERRALAKIGVVHQQCTRLEKLLNDSTCGPAA